MKLKKMYPIMAVLLVGFLGSCKKNADSNLQDPNNGSPMAAGPSAPALKKIDLRDANHFAILSQSGIADASPSIVTGDVGTSPASGSAIALTCAEVTGNIYSVDAAGPLPCRKTDANRLNKAVVSMQNAYTDAAGRLNPNFLNLGAGNIGGMTLTPGLYKWNSAVTIPSNITISGKGGDVWIFQVDGALDMSTGVKIILAGDAKADNIFWQVAGAVTLGMNSHFAGNILGKTDINLQSGASINGGLFAQNMVNLNNNNITTKPDQVIKPQPGAAAVNLGGAGNFAILSQSGVTDVSPSAITGNVGSSPITGAAILVTCSEVTGNIYSVDAAGPMPCVLTDASGLTTAIGDMQIAYNDASGRIHPNFLNLGAGNIGGLTLRRGLYKWTSALTIPTNITISGGPNDTWIFQVDGTLDLSTSVNIILAGGAQAKNIIWVVAGAVTLGPTSHFEGTILGKTGINMQTGASINGSLLAQTAVTLQMNTVVKQ